MIKRSISAHLPLWLGQSLRLYFIFPLALGNVKGRSLMLVEYILYFVYGGRGEIAGWVLVFSLVL